MIYEANYLYHNVQISPKRILFAFTSGMVKTRSMTRNWNYDDDDAYSWKRIKTCNKRVMVHWSDLNQDLLLLVMMRLGVIDFVAFSGVCKSWRSFAVCNRKMFMASKQPISMWISAEDNKKDYCYLEDFEGRKFKTILPHYVGRRCVGLTCGYLILLGSKTKDFWLVNPITRHQLHFPDFPDDHGGTCTLYRRIRAILVFSPSLSGWLFVMSNKHNKIWFSIAGKGVWNHVSSTSYIWDLHAFKGKIYTLNVDYVRGDMVRHLCEMRLGPEPKLMVLETKNFPKRIYFHFFASYGENLFVVDYESADWYKFHKLDFGKMEWVLYADEKTKEEFAVYRNHMGHMIAAKQESWAGIYNGQRCMFSVAGFWYFPHDCLNVNLMDE